MNDDVPSYDKYKARYRKIHKTVRNKKGEEVILSKEEKELETIDELRIRILKTRADMWKYYISAITRTPCTEYELYQFL